MDKVHKHITYINAICFSRWVDNLERNHF